MYIVAIAWIYVISMASIAMPSLLAGVSVFLGAGLVPLLLLGWLAGLRRAGRQSVPDETAQQRNGADSQPDEGHLLQGGAQVDAPVQARDQVRDRHVDHARGDEPEQ